MCLRVFEIWIRETLVSTIDQNYIFHLVVAFSEKSIVLRGA